MKSFRFAAICGAVMLGMSCLALAGEGEGKGGKLEGKGRFAEGRGPGGGMGRGGQGMAERWFMELPDVKAEVERFSKEVADIDAQIKECIKGGMDEAKAADKADGAEATWQKSVEKILALATKKIDARAAHQTTMTELLKKHKEEAVAELKKKMQEMWEKRKAAAANKDKDGKDSKDPDSPSFEGAVF